MSMLAGTAFISGGNINPATFVSINGNFQVIAAVNNDAQIIGIAQIGTDIAVPPGSTVLAAKSGETLQVFGPGDVCLLKVTSAVTAGQLLGSDANAQGVAINLGSTTVQYFGCRALESANAGEFCRVVVIIGGITGT
jgi:hypothetical protein